MLEETYDKFKKQLKDKKIGNDNLPEIVYNSEQQVHHICSYNHYRIKDDEVNWDLLIMTSIIQMSLHMNLNMAFLKISLKVSN